MQQSAIKYSVLYIVLGFCWVVVCSFIFQQFSDGPFSSSLGGDILKGLFLVVSTSIFVFLGVRHIISKQVENKNQYKRLFEENPNPMWVYDLESLKILAVNQAAVQTYGFSREEFLALTILELRPKEEAEKLLKDLKSESPTYSNSGTWLHRRKNGEQFYVSVFSHRTHFNHHRARLVLAFDINNQLVAQKRIETQNERLREIAHLQSHNVRRPVASILGLINLFDRKNPANEMNGLVIEKLDVVCKELDITIHKIVEKTYELEVEQQEQHP